MLRRVPFTDPGWGVLTDTFKDITILKDQQEKQSYNTEYPSKPPYSYECVIMF